MLSNLAKISHPTDLDNYYFNLELAIKLFLIRANRLSKPKFWIDLFSQKTCVTLSTPTF